MAGVTGLAVYTRPAGEGTARLAPGPERWHPGEGPGPVVWTLPAYYGIYGPEGEVEAVSEWAEACGFGWLDVRHGCRVEKRPAGLVAVCTEDRREHEALLAIPPPPALSMPPRPDLHALIEEHRPCQYPLHDFGAATWCGACSVPGALVAWQCGVLARAIAEGSPA